MSQVADNSTVLSDSKQKRRGRSRGVSISAQSVRPVEPLPLRLGFHAAFRLRSLLAAAAGAGFRHGRATAGRGVIAKVAGGLVAGDQLLDLLAGQRLVFEQPL